MIKELLEKRNVPSLKTREEMLEILQREEYGFMPKKPDRMTYKVTDGIIDHYCAGKATLQRVEITSYFGDVSFTFPCHVSIPAKEGKHPFFVAIMFRDSIPDRHLQSEEIVDHGYAVLSFCYNDVTTDNNDFTNGLAGVLYKNGERGDTDAGKLAMWAWAAQRVLDYAETLENLDMNCSVVCGHSRLGKTALWAAATDERFKFGYSNDSGCSGAAITRGKAGEDVDYISRTFPYWFCKNYYKYAKKEDSMPFDQHYLIASIAPRFAYVASAVEDEWADPVSEMMACIAASDMYEKYGKDGFVFEDRIPVSGDEFHEGSIGYHLRAGLHFFSREDWNIAIKYINRHR